MIDFFSMIKMSFKNLKNNAMRTFLTMLGVIIGIASIIALLTIGQGVTNSVIDKISGLGGNNLTVSINNKNVKKGFSESELQLFADIDGVSGVSPSLSVSKMLVLMPELTTSKYDGIYTKSARILGVSEYYFSNSNNQKGVAYGRGISPFDVSSATNVCVLGYERWQQLYGNYLPIGETLKIENVEFTIVGIMNKTVGLDTTANNAVLVPYTTAINSLKTGLPTSLDVYFESAEVSDKVIVAVDALCAELLNSPDGSYYSLVNQKEVTDVVLTVTDLVLGMLAGIAVISLIVGGIGIMNMMLVTVSERTSEIGLRKALGARPSVILYQFLTESVILSSIGGILGIGFGMLISYLASVAIGYTFTYSVSTILLAALFSLFVGVVFGILPAKRAAALNPIDALRSQ